MSWPGQLVGKVLSGRRGLIQVSLLLGAYLTVLIGLSDPSQGGVAESSDPHVSQFTPRGTVKHVRQVSARFSDLMVPLGDPRSIVDPFAIDCPEPGTARWADSRTWLYDFTRDLPGGVRCTFQLRPGVVTLAGKAVGGRRTFTFSTGGPAIQSSVPSDEATISEDQAFVVALDAQPTEESVLAHVSLSAAPIPERISVHILTGETREAILKTLYGWSSREHVIVLQARQRFPSGANVRLVWGKGVTSASGVANERDQVLSFKVRDPFIAEFVIE